MKKIITFFLGFVCLVTANAQLCHSSIAPLTATNTPCSIASADFNNDGNQDIIAGVFNKIYVYLGNGNGAFTATTSITVSGKVISMCTGNYNSDGNKDFVFLIENSAAFAALGSGIGTFTVGGGYLGCLSPLTVLTDDFNNDNIQDLIITDGCSQSFHRYFGNGDGTFATTSSSILVMGGGNISTGGVTADFNGDNNKDLIVCNIASNDISVYLGTGTGSFAPVVKYPVGSKPTGIASADFNKDGNLDIVTANLNADSVSVLMGNGTGAFATAVYYKVGTKPKAIAAKDLNGDGNIDLAVANFTSNNVSILQGSNAGIFQTAINYTVGTAPNGIVLSDFNGDTKPDLATCDNIGYSLSVWLSSYPSPVITGSNTVCQGTSLTLTATAFATNSFTWSTSSTNNTLTFSPSSSTVISVSATSSLGCSETKTMAITVLNLPALGVSSTKNLVCNGESTSLTVNGAATYSWATGVSGPVITVTPQSTFVYSVTGTDLNGCVNKTTFTQSVTTCSGFKLNLDSPDNISIFPNPSNGQFSVLLTGISENAMIEIYNSLGEQILNQPIINKNYFDLSAYPVGVYIYSIKHNGSKVKQGKLILK